MSTKTIYPRWSLFIVTAFLSALLFIIIMGGCASSTSVKTTTGPGTPDETQVQHYEMVVSAIAAKNRTEALAALALLQADVFRWHEDTLTVANALTDLAALTDAVDKEDWALADKWVQELKSKYRRP
jgi:hypothetical protein